MFCAGSALVGADKGRTEELESGLGRVGCKAYRLCPGRCPHRLPGRPSPGRPAAAAETGPTLQHTPSFIGWAARAAALRQLCRHVAHVPSVTTPGPTWPAGPQVWDPERVVIIPDHYIFTSDPRANRNVDILREVAQK